ncbi:GAF domain-like protein, partial [Amylostereum chailletii]
KNAMPHADSSLVPSTVQSKSEFWIHVHDQLSALLDGQRDWITNLANAASLIYTSLLAFPPFGDGPSSVNWCGFYIHSKFFPAASLVLTTAPTTPNPAPRLLLAPFCGKPACQFIGVAPGKARGVCADAFLSAQTRLVPNVHAYPGHIACDGATQSELVCPLVLPRADASDVVLGVLDLDCLALGGFDEDDRVGLEKIARLVVDACDYL